MSEWQYPNTNLGQASIDVLVGNSDGWKNPNENLGQSSVYIGVVSGDWRNPNENLGQATVLIGVTSGGWQNPNTTLGQATTSITIIQAPVPEPPPIPSGKIFGGKIVSFTPTQLAVGAPLKFTVVFDILTNSLVEKVNGWYADVTLKLDTMIQTVKSNPIYGSDAKGVTCQFDFKTVMSDKTLKGTITLVGLKGGFSTYQETLEIKNVTVAPPGKPDETDIMKMLPWVAAGALGLMALSGKRSNQRSKKK